MRSFKIILLLLLLTIAHSAFAQGGSGGQAPPGASSSSQQSILPDPRMGTEDISEELNILTTQLNLNEDQKNKARTILEERQRQVLETRNVKFPVAKPGASPNKEGLVAMDKVVSEGHAKMLTILNEEQKKKYDLIDTNVQSHAAQVEKNMK